MDHGVVRVSHCCSGDSVVDSTDCSVAVIQTVAFSGRAFNELSVFGEIMGEIAFVKVAWYNNQGIRICSLNTQYLVDEHTLCLLDAGLRTQRHVDADQDE